jgi:hypothetical protein
MVGLGIGFMLLRCSAIALLRALAFCALTLPVLLSCTLAFRALALLMVVYCSTVPTAFIPSSFDRTSRRLLIFPLNVSWLLIM